MGKRKRLRPTIIVEENGDHWVFDRELFLSDADFLKEQFERTLNFTEAKRLLEVRRSERMKQRENE